MKCYSNGKEVTKEEFESLVGEQFKWFQNDTVNAVDFSSVSNLLDGNFKSQRQINNHIKGVLGGYNKPKVKQKEKDDVINSVNRGEKEMMESFKKDKVFPMKTCSNSCLCDGSCKKEIKEPFSILVSKPNPFNQSNFFDRKQSEQEILDTFKRNMNRIEGIKETEGKLNYELDWEFIQQLAERMSQNKGKYEPYNWAKPMDVEKLKQSLFRHVIEVMKGNYSDDGREFGHWESIALNAMMINYQLKNNS